jgi:hypothetical protein
MPKLKSLVLVLVVVLVLDLLGFCVERRRGYSRTIPFYQRDGDIPRILEHEQEHELSTSVLG